MCNRSEGSRDEANQKPSKGQRQRSSYLTHWIKDIRESILEIVRTCKEMAHYSVDLWKTVKTSDT